ncbi:MAG: SMC-Scp complex subunit ScpB [Clostridia bacterium]|nr:SMC-Scp complex subunit ScpB [Clostridia bacterium]
MLFASSTPVRAGAIASALEIDEATVVKLIREIRDRHACPESGFVLSDVDDGFIMLSRPDYAQYVEAVSRRERPQPLSPAAMETLAIVAYRQPVTRGEIDKIRGVVSDSSVSTLAERGLIVEMGRRNTVGRPVLYGTTQDFLLYLGLGSIADLPALPEEERDPSEDAKSPDSAAPTLTGIDGGSREP